MSTEPRCKRCRRLVLVARTLPGLATILLDPQPTLAGNFEVDLDQAPPTARWRRAYGVPHYGGPLYERHQETCPKTTTATDSPPARSAAANGP